MKRRFISFLSAVVVAFVSFAQTGNVVYSWESPEGTVIEKGGTAASLMGSDDRANYPNAGYYTLCLNGKKANVADTEASANATRIVITLDEALQEGDSIYVTAYRNKNADGKKSTIYFLYENGTTVADTKVFTNICADDTDADYDDDGATPTTHGYLIPAEAAGSKTITLTRNDGGTNLFITKFVIVRQAAEEEEPVVDPNDYTSAIKNASVAENAEWEGGLSHGNGGLYKTSAASFDFTQTITLPAGQYKMTVQAAYRYAGSNDTPTSEEFEYNQIQAGVETHLAKLYAQTASYKYEANVQNRWEGASETNYAPEGENVSTVNGKFVPNSSNAVKAWFDAGKYVNELVFNVQEDGEVKIGIAKTEGAPNGDYTNIGAWTLTRLGDAEADPVVYTMVQNEADLVVGGKYLIMAQVDGGWVALSDQSGNIRVPSDTLTVSENFTIETVVATAVAESPAKFEGVAYELTLEGEAGAWKFKDELNGAYLHWSSGNYLINDAEGSAWTIAFNQYGHNAVITHAVTTERVLQYNASSPRFCAYTSVQAPVYLFKAGEVTVAPVAPSNPSFNTIAELLAFETGNVVDLNVNKAKITYLSGNNMSITDGTDTLAVYDYNIPADYAVGGWLNGKITATLGEYKGNKQLTVVDWDNVTFVAPVTVESPWVGAVAESGATYYFYNPAAKAFLKAGNAWGTRASFGQDAYPVILEGGNGVYALNTTLTFAGKYMRPDLFMDQTKTDFTFNEVGEGIYTIYLASNGYVAYTGANTVEYAAEVNDGCYWQLLTADAIKEQMLAADAYNPYDVTALIPGANFGRNNAQNSAWTAINTNAYDNAGGANGDKSGGDNNNQQVWNAELTKVSQVLTGLPNGTYQLNAQAFYRLGGVAAAAAARTAGTEIYDVKLFANTDSVMVMSVMEEAGKLDVGSNYEGFGKAPDNQSQARDYFTAGYYDHTIYFTVTDGTANIGVVKNSSVGADWLVFDNFRLTYYGTASVEDVKLAVPRKAFLDRYTAMEQFSQESMSFVWNGINNTYFWPVMDEAMLIKDTIDKVTDLALLDSMMIEMDKAEDTVLKAYALGDEYNKVKNVFWDASDNSTAISDEARMAMEAALENSNYASYTLATIEALEAALADLKAEYIAYVGNAVANEGFLFDVTCVLVNPSFETGDLTGWTVSHESSDTGVRTNSGSHATEGTDGTHLFNTWWQGVLLSQEVVGLPNGKYTLTIAMASGDTGNDATAYIIANTDTMGINLSSPGAFVDYSLNVEVDSQKLYVATIGGNDDDTAENPIGSFNPNGHWWYKADNFRLYYAGVEKTDSIEPFTDFYTNPSGEEALESLGNIELFFFDLVENVVVSEEVQATLTTPIIVDDEYLVASVWTSLYVNEDNPENVFNYICFELEETYTEPGEYVLNIPAGLFTVEGAPNAETQVYFTVKAAAAGFEAEILGVTPEAGEVTELSEIIVQFSNDQVMPYSNIFLTDEAGTQYEFELDVNHPNYTQAKYVAKDGAITAAGTYTLDCSQIDHMNMMTGSLSHPFTGTYSWTIKVVDGIENIEIARDAVIYTITGKRVQGNVKTLERGIYIINGKKVLVK